MNKRIVAAVVVLLLIVGVVWGFDVKKKMYNTTQQTTIERAIRVVTLQSADEGLFLKDLAEEKGFFEKRNLKIENISVEKNGGDLIINNAGDVYLGGIAGTLSDFLNNLDFKWIATTTTHPYNMAAVSRFSRGEEEKIRKVAVTRIGGANELQVRDALQKIGVDAEKVEFVVTPIASRAVMLETGDIDFTVVDLDMSGKSETQKVFEKYTIYAPTEAFTSGIAVRGISTMQKVMDAKNGELQDFVAGIQEALIYTDGHQDEAIEFLQKRYEFSLKNAEKFYENYTEARKGAEFVPNADVIANAVNIMKEKFNPTNPDRNIEDFINKDYANAAVGK